MRSLLRVVTENALLGLDRLSGYVRNELPFHVRHAAQ